MSQGQEKLQSYNASVFNYVMDTAPFQQEMKNENLPFFGSFGQTVYNQAKLVDTESELKGQTRPLNRCDNSVNSNLGM